MTLAQPAGSGRFSAGHRDMAFVATAFFAATQQGSFSELAAASPIQVAWSVIKAQLDPVTCISMASEVKLLHGVLILGFRVLEFGFWGLDL